jgi:hypothetical protein
MGILEKRSDFLRRTEAYAQTVIERLGRSS